MTSPNRERKRDSGSSKSTQSSLKNSRSVPLFDLASLSEDLPPNTGPSENNYSASGSGTSTSKSLSHVPCKFYKQGICQAGNSCPFSHDLDDSSSEKLACKYFQKGNCKFGSKCALAHILPDGTHANAKPARRSNGRSDRSLHNHSGASKHFRDKTGSSAGMNTQGNVVKESQKKTADYEDVSLLEEFGTKESSSFDYSDHFEGTESKSQSVYPDTNAWSAQYSSNILSLPHILPNSGRKSYSTTNYQPYLVFEESPIYRDSGQTSLNPNSTFGSLSFSKQSFGGGASSPLQNYTRLSAESTSVDDDSDEIACDEDANFEDYVPASIGNLILTPQEQKRRESRSQSGTLLVRPNVGLSCQEEKRQGPIELITRGFEDVFLMD